MDRSGSIEQSDFDLVKAFAVDLVLDTNVHTGEARVGVIAYSDDAEVIFQVCQKLIQFLFTLVSKTSELCELPSILQYVSKGDYNYSFCLA